MLRKLTALFLVIALSIVDLSTTTFAIAEETATEMTLIKTLDKVIASKEVEGSTLTCEYMKDTQKYYLCVDENRQELDVHEEDGTIVVTIADYSEDLYETKIVAQSVTYVTVVGGFLTVAMIYAARDLIIATLQATWDIVKKGYDVFAPNAAAACYICTIASPKKHAVSHDAHVKAEGYYKHYHPKGVKWYRNKNYQPHCWYPN